MICMWALYKAKFENLLCIALLLLATKEEKALSSKMPWRHIWVRKQRLCLVKKNTQKLGGWIWFLKSFQSQQIQTQYKQNKEIEFREFKLGFIVVRHFLAYVHSPQPPNRVRVSLTWSFNQASNLLTLGFRLQWALTQSLQDSNLLKALTLRLIQEMIH